MTGMGGSLGTSSTYVTHRFNTALWHQLGLITLLILAVVVVSLLFLRRKGIESGPSGEPMPRKILRLGFGGLWVIAGLLQLQPQMPIGLPTAVISPMASNAPHWVQSMVNFGTNAWLRHPIVGAAAVVWLQLGLGLWLLFADRGWLSRSAGWASAAWAAGIWIFGNAIGALFVAPLSWMNGAPGAPLFYCAAGVALGLPATWWHNEVWLKRCARAFGILLAYFAVLQAWPGRGFWGGGTTKDPGAITAMAQAMGGVHQPALTTTIQNHVATFALHGSWFINLVVVVGLGVAGIGFLRASKPSVSLAARVYLILALLDWIFIQDLGVFGGLATDVNSMLPSALVGVTIWSAFLATSSAPAVTLSEKPAPLARRVGAFSAIAMFLVGALPMAALLVLPGATADAASASGSGVASVALTAPNFTLTDQNGGAFSLSSTRGHMVVLTFLDPVCTSDCPIEAQQMKAAAEQLGAGSGTQFVAVNANPNYTSVAAIQAFDTQEGLSNWADWHFVTGTPAQLAQVWKNYGVDVVPSQNGSMVTHTEPFYVIDRQGVVRSTWAAVTGGGATTILGRSGTALIVAQVQAAS